MAAVFDVNDRVVSAPDARRSVLYKLVKAAVKAAKIKDSLSGTKQQVLEKAAKMNEKRQFVMPEDKKANYTDHMILGQYHCLEVNTKEHRKKRAVMFVFGGGMILGSDSKDVGLCAKIARQTGTDVWFPYYPMCHEHDMLENVQMIFECYEKMLTFYKPENIVFLGFSSGGALILDLITYINELNDSGSSIPMPGMLIPVSPGSVPVTEAEKVCITVMHYNISFPAASLHLMK